MSYKNNDGVEIILSARESCGLIAINENGEIGRINELGGFIKTRLELGNYELKVSVPFDELCKKKKATTHFLIRAERIDRIRPDHYSIPSITGIKNSSMSAFVSVVEGGVNRPGNYIHAVIKKHEGFKIIRISLEFQQGVFKIIERVLWRAQNQKILTYRKHGKSTGPFLFDKRDVNSVIYKEWPLLDQEMANRGWFK